MQLQILGNRLFFSLHICLPKSLTRVWDSGFARKLCHNVDDKMKTIFDANSNFTIVFNFGLHTKIISSRSKDFVVSCGTMNEKQLNYKLCFCLCESVCLSYIFFHFYSDDECQLTWGFITLGERILRANKIKSRQTGRGKPFILVRCVCRSVAKCRTSAKTTCSARDTHTEIDRHTNTPNAIYGR